MDNIKAFSDTKQGKKHIDKNIICQDASGYIEIPEQGIYGCVVSDGHGGERYFRSDRGSKFAIEITLKAIRLFIANIDTSLFAVPYTTVIARSTEILQKISRKETEQDKSLRQLFAYIISEWNDRIEQDWQENPPTVDETGSLSEKIRLEYQQNKNIEKAYGCTLIVFVRTPDYWFAFHLGDGKCIAFYKDGSWNEPIPWDEQCFLNYTTSMCDKRVLDNFRYCYGNDHFPVALLVGSDGMDDSFGQIEKLVDFYSVVIKMFVREGYEKSLQEIAAYLPQLSAKGSQDDMSLAGVLDLEGMKEIIPILIKKQEEQAYHLIQEAELKEKKARDIWEQKQKEWQKNSLNKDVLKEGLKEEDSKIETEKCKETNLQKRGEKFIDALNHYLNQSRDSVKDYIRHKEGLVKELKEKELLLSKLETELKYAEADINKAGQERDNARVKLKELSEEYDLFVKIGSEYSKTGI